MEALPNPLRTGIILLGHMNDNAEAKLLRAKPVIASHSPVRVAIYEI
jgi:hypothetical protein